MKINVSDTKEEIGSHKAFSFASSAEKIAIDNDDFLKYNIVKVEGEVVNTGHALDVSGIIWVEARFTCNRCLEEFNTTLEIPFNDSYQEGNPDNNAEAESAYYQGTEIDISDLVRESIILAKPLKTLCAENCRGLCPKCGINLNSSSCSCEHDDIDPRLAALKQLLKD